MRAIYQLLSILNRGEVDDDVEMETLEGRRHAMRGAIGDSANCERAFLGLAVQNFVLSNLLSCKSYCAFTNSRRVVKIYLRCARDI